MFEFKIKAKDKNTKARTGEFITPHGTLPTPNLAIVATDGEVKVVPKDKLKDLPIDYVIVNTFHHLTKNILKKYENDTTIHTYAGFEKVVASDSGGFQVFSLGFAKTHEVGKIGGLFPGKEHANMDINNPIKITDEGVEFTYDDKPIILTPEKSIELQRQIGADIMFAFDECTSPLNSYEYTKQAMERTHRWLTRCLIAKDKAGVSSLGSRQRGEFSQLVAGSSIDGKNEKQAPPTNQALFAIVQGGYFEDLRKISAAFVGKQDVPGFGIGGSLGKTKEEMLQVLDWTIPLLPEEKPRHLLGIGHVRDIFEAVERGVDLFDCVVPTREARHKVLYTKRGKLQLRKMKLIDEVIEKDCECETCKTQITMKKLYELFLQKDPLAYYYATVHNIQFFMDLMKNIRLSIKEGSLKETKNKYLAAY